jgi:hypothetical protein
MQADAGAQALSRDVGEFPKHGDNNGVSISAEAIDEASPGDEAQGTQESPDGVLYVCRFNIDRLLKDAQALAVYHIGQHIYDLRSTTANEVATLYTLENNAWVITAAGSARVGEPFLTLPGGDLFLSSSWPMDQRDDKMEDALTDFLTKEMMLAK